MAYDGWVRFNGTELVNLSRTSQLASELGIAVVYETPAETQWIEDALGGVDYGDITTAPWYDSTYPASAEFAGIVPLAMAGMGDSTREATTVEYTTNGGHSGQSRNATLPIVANVVIVATTDRGAEYGKRWMDRVLSATSLNTFCAGADLEYFRYKGSDGVTPPRAHYRNVRLTRGTSITRKRITDCDASWWMTYTWTANDPFEYGEAEEQITSLGGLTATGPQVATYGSIVLTQESCPVWDYTPIFDPLYPALVPSPTAPDFLPDGWGIVDGMTFDRFWAKINPVDPVGLNVVPVFTITTDIDARMVRIGIWPSDSDADDQCDPLWSAVLTYVPAGQQFVLDGEQEAAYVWDGLSPVVRRSDSLVFSPDANPVQWSSFSDSGSMRVTLDVFSDSDGYEGDGTVRLALELVPKSD